MYKSNNGAMPFFNIAKEKQLKKKKKKSPPYLFSPIKLKKKKKIVKLSFFPKTYSWA